MLVQVLYFHTAKRAADADSESIDLPPGSTTGDLLSALIRSHPALGPMTASLLLAVNEEHAGRERVLAEGDIIAVMPPFSGG